MGLDFLFMMKTDQFQASDFDYRPPVIFPVPMAADTRGSCDRLLHVHVNCFMQESSPTIGDVELFTGIALGFIY